MLNRLYLITLVFFIASFEVMAHSPYLEWATHPEWLKLIHYRKTLLGDFKSEIDGQKFFLASQGKTNPEEELVATIELMGKPFDYKIGKVGQHPQCAYPARFEFLKREKLFVGTEYPCPDLEYWKRGLGAGKAWIIFASNYPNNPSSAFGHTFLRIDNAEKKEGQEILQYGINFSAVTDTTNGIAFGIKGLLGGYEGHFSIMPYYLKINEYKFLEARDLWEYELNLSPQQINTVLNHLWELENNGHFDYFFLDENCSYQILGLLDVANPNWNLAEDIGTFVIPIETIKLLKKKNILLQTKYRPSLRKERNERVRILNDEERKTYFTFLKKKDVKKEELPKGDLLDTLITQFQYAQKRKFLTPEQNKTYLLALSERASDPMPVKTLHHDWPVSPELGHGPRGFSFSKLNRPNGDGYAFTYRFASHDLLSPEQGQQPNSELKLGEVKMRTQHQEFFIEKLTLFDASSFWNFRFDDPAWSWRFKVEASRPLDLVCQNCLMGVTQGSLGFTASDPKNGHYFYLMAQGTLLATHQMSQTWGALISPYIGHIWRGKYSASQLEAYYHNGNTPYTGTEFVWKYSLHLKNNVEWRLNVHRKQSWIDGEYRNAFETGPLFNF